MKLENLRTHWRLWLPGLLIALAGVAVARLAAPHYTGKTHTVLLSLGRLTAFAGLFHIALTLKRRAQNNPDDTPPNTS